MTLEDCIHAGKGYRIILDKRGGYRLTSSQAQAYAVVALNELIKSGELKLDASKVESLKRFSREMFAVIYSMEGQEAEKEADRLLGSVISLNS